MRKKKNKQKRTALLLLNIWLRFHVRRKLQTLAHRSQHKSMHLGKLTTFAKPSAENVR